MDAEVRAVLVGMKTELSKGWIQGNMQTDEGVCLYGAVVEAAGIAPRPVDGSAKKSSRTKDVKGRKSINVPPGTLCVAYTFDYASPAGRAMRAISAEVGVELEDLALWNDEGERTVDEIVAAIDRILTEDKGPSGRAELIKTSKQERVPAKV